MLVGQSQHGADTGCRPWQGYGIWLMGGHPFISRVLAADRSIQKELIRGQLPHHSGKEGLGIHL
jgi:hypothetical protein